MNQVQQRLAWAATFLCLWLAVGHANGQTFQKLNCPQPRFTDSAPAEYLKLRNPLKASAEDLALGQRLYAERPRGASCAACHGVRGDGDGKLASMFNPPPRNFACAKTIVDIPDGQLFWIIRFGSPGTAMPGHPSFDDNDIWRLVMYLRQLASILPQATP